MNEEKDVPRMNPLGNQHITHNRRSNSGLLQPTREEFHESPSFQFPSRRPRPAISSWTPPIHLARGPTLCQSTTFLGQLPFRDSLAQIYLLIDNFIPNLLHPSHVQLSSSVVYLGCLNSSTTTASLHITSKRMPRLFFHYGFVP